MGKPNLLVVFMPLFLSGCGKEHIRETADAGSTAELEFLSDIPEFHQLRLGITEDELASLVAANDLSISVMASEEDGQAYRLYRRDGENVIVTFREGTCSGVQRMRRNVSGVPSAE